MWVGSKFERFLVIRIELYFEEQNNNQPFFPWGGGVETIVRKIKILSSEHIIDVIHILQ